MTTPTTYRLSELNGFIRRVFALNLPEPVWVTAELAQANTARGHCWLTLVEKGAETNEPEAQLEGVVWAGQLKELQRKYGLKQIRGVLTEGMSVRLRITMSFHPRYGLRAVVDDIDPDFTIGELERHRRAVLERLSAEGLLERNACPPFPVLPQRLAVISSATAAGLADFREQLDGNPYGYRFTVRLFPATMQGGQAAKDISARLRQLRAWEDAFDAVVIVRGGGARTDLAAFDDEDLCRAVANCHLPVVVGVGHETDESVLDRVAARSLKTPTATAGYFIDLLAEAESRTVHLGRAISRAVHQTLAHEAPRPERYLTTVRQLAANNLDRARMELDGIQSSLLQAKQQGLREAGNHLLHLEQLLAALRPEATLERGFALVTQAGTIITDPDQIEAGELTVRLRDGRTVLRRE